jgi:hypothetical protein
MPQTLKHFWHWSRRGALCLALVATANCDKKKAAPADSISIDQPHPPDLMAGTTLLATLERTGCYGECPVYRVTVSTDGSVVYVGTRWVKVLGRQEYKLSAAQVSDIVSAFERANFATLRDYDHVESTDDDWAHVSFLWGGRLKRVRHYHGDNAAPPALSALEDELDRVTDTGRFVGVPATSGASPATPLPASPMPSPSESAKAGTPGRPGSSAKPSETAGPPDESPADPDNHP